MGKPIDCDNTRLYNAVVNKFTHQYPTAVTPYSAWLWLNPSNSSCSIRPEREKDMELI
nr:MAG TPA: hypothetical protein [Caudoviricetes sp.]